MRKRGTMNLFRVSVNIGREPELCTGLGASNKRQRNQWLALGKARV